MPGSAQMVIGAAGAGIIGAIDPPLTMLDFTALAAGSLLFVRR